MTVGCRFIEESKGLMLEFVKMSQEKNDLVALEGLMKEFFDGNTRNEKRKEIERVLTNFKNQPGSWKLCFNYMALTKCEFSSMFCLNTVEDIINKQWMSLPWDEKAQIKNHMCNYVLENHEKLSPCLLSKSIKLVVDIARLDWPHFYPDFFSNIILLLQKSDTRHLGLMYLLITCEELIAPREDLSFDRKSELKKLLITQMPQVFTVLFEFLTNDIIVTNPKEGCLILKILTHLFSWVPSSEVPNDFISIIFKLASNTKNEEISIMAMTTLNEMLYRHWLPPHCTEIISLTLELTQSLLSSPLDQISESFMEKFSELLRLAVPLHLSLPVYRQSSDTGALFSAVINFTVNQPTLFPGFACCLQIWLHLLENPHSQSYTGAFLALVPQILNKIQFRLNGDKLKMLDDEIIDDDGETEWKKLLTPCIEIVAKVAEMEPFLILRSAFEKWRELCESYAQILTNLTVQDSDNVTMLLRDLSTFTQIMGRLQYQCSGENWQEESLFAFSRLTFQHLLTLNDLGTNIEYHSMSPIMKISFERVQAEALASLKSWCYWLPLLRSENSTKPLLDDFVKKVINGCVPYLNVNSPPVLQHCAAHVMSTVTGTIRTGTLCELESIKCLLSNKLTHLRIEDQYLIQGSLVNCLVLKWPDPTSDTWNQRLAALSKYVEQLTASFVALPLEFNLENKPLIMSSLRLMEHIIMLYKYEGVKTKTIICLAFQKSAEHALALFPAFVSDTQVSEGILTFFFIVLECLQQQVGVTFTQIAIQTFMDTYTRRQLQISLAVKNGGGLQQLLQILDLVVQTPGLSASKVTPMAVDLCMQLFEPALTDTASPCVQESLFHLVHSILIHKWHYFFKAPTEPELRSKEFLDLMKAIGQSFFLLNMNLFRQNLETIEKVNMKWNLYREEVFKKELHSQFLTALFNILIDRRHSLVNDELAAVICNLILVDINYFYNDFLPKYLDSIENLDSFQKVALLSNFKNHIDTPSITQNIFRFANDLICYQLCNSYVPQEAETM